MLSHSKEITVSKSSVPVYAVAILAIIFAFGLFFVAQCPACASLGVLFLPVSVIGVLTQFGWLINLLGIGLLLFAINYLGGFKKS